ncbi:ComEA family DNA-binding protein [Pontibacter lucknowensis]|uniref:Competence protein ComEA helix-hairpin-helix repeat region n=1 Tax=Pontibacter lucknowensis TaxID=1077936 RepID=A0A1N6TMJ9_9BACT|nr:helix-hairpin-helix domain-containing protein [Pontibacter lucknowensis]SIQ54474.1 competence protein ComEA helix-hairpin-helix repeat region [Pontibacter lucknowensis]
MRKLKYWIRRNFGFSQGEVNGFLVLIGAMVLLTAAPLLFKWFTKPETGTFESSLSDKQLLDSLVAQLEAKQPERKGGREIYRVPVALQPFNPNHLSEEQWQGLGMPNYMAKRILNFRNKVGDFTYKAQLGTIYGLPDSVFQKLYPYIQLPEARPDRNSRTQGIAGSPRTAPNPNWASSPRPRERFILAPFNINTADTTALKQIKGIGSKLSARIVKYRDGLGGFHSMAQVQEVFGLPPTAVDSLQKYTFVPKANTLQQLSLNQVSADQLKAHPYISSNVARAIVAYREQHGAFRQVEDIRQIKIVTQELFEKISPYLVL